MAINDNNDTQGINFFSMGNAILYRLMRISVSPPYERGDLKLTSMKNKLGNRFPIPGQPPGQGLTFIGNLYKVPTYQV